MTPKQFYSEKFSVTLTRGDWEYIVTSLQIYAQYKHLDPTLVGQEIINQAKEGAQQRVSKIASTINESIKKRNNES